MSESFIANARRGGAETSLIVTVPVNIVGLLGIRRDDVLRVSVEKLSVNQKLTKRGPRRKA